MMIKELTNLDEMLEHVKVMQELYPSLTRAEYQSLLTKMVSKGYQQVAVFEDDVCIGLCGYWLGTKLWCGNFLEIDNFVVSSRHRAKGIGRLIYSHIDKRSKEENCNIQVADAYATNYKAHRFYYNNGFGPKGFHFVKVTNKFGLR